MQIPEGGGLACSPLGVLGVVCTKANVKDPSSPPQFLERFTCRQYVQINIS